MRFEIYPVYNIQSSENSAVVKCTLNEYFFSFSDVLSVSKSIETNIIFVSTVLRKYKTFGLSKSNKYQVNKHQSVVVWLLLAFNQFPV